MVFIGNKFDTFNPVSSEIPQQPFSYLPDIAWRARLLLKQRSEEQIKDLAELISLKFGKYFTALKQAEIDKRKQSNDWQVEETSVKYSIACEESPTFITLNEVDFTDLPRETDCNEVDVLKDCIDQWESICQSHSLDDTKPYELFATLSLWLIADSLRCLNPDQDKTENTNETIYSASLNENSRKYEGFYRLSNAGEFALKAMDAVCFAERLRKIDRINELNKKQIELTKEEFLQAKLNDEALERHELQARAIELNKYRHKRDYEAKLLVLSEWNKDRTKFPSAEKAGNYLADWLIPKGYSYVPRTITNWIRAYAKEHRIRLK